MKAICVVRESNLEVQEVPQPSTPAEGHLLVQMEASAINPGDKYFLHNPAARAFIAGSTATNNVWGASGAGTIVAVGKNVPSHFAGKRVAIYRSLARTPETIGLWCQTAQAHFTSCVVLPDTVNAQDYSGSLVNVITAYTFLDQITDDGHRGVIATAGASATGRALLELARLRKIPAIALVRAEQNKSELAQHGFENVLVTSDTNFENKMRSLAATLGTTAVFEGIGGEIVTRIAPLLPPRSAFYFYGFLAGTDSFSVQSRMMMERGLTMRSFSNFMTKTAQDPNLLAEALSELSKVIEHPVFRTKAGPKFKFEEIHEAIKYQGEGGSKCLLIP